MNINNNFSQVESNKYINIYSFENNVTIENIKYENNILDLNKNNYDILEDFIFNSVYYHLNNNNYIENKVTSKQRNNIFNYIIEYKIINRKEILYIENKEKITPVFSILNNFENEINEPIIFTNINTDNYKYNEIEEIENKDGFLLTFIEKNTQCLFDSSKYFYIINNHSEMNINYLLINVWEIENNNNNINVPNNKIKDFNFKNITKITQNIMINHENFLYDFFYKQQENINIIKSMLNEEAFSEIKNNNVFVIKSNNLYNRIVNNKHSSNFLKEIIKKGMSIDVCYWILNEINKKNNWEIRNNISYFDLENTSSVMSYLFFVIKQWINYIKNELSLNDDFEMNIKNLFVYKFEKKSSNIFNDHNFLSIHINLSNSKDYKGGEYIINNDEMFILEQCDILLYNANYKLNTQIYDGERYILVITINKYIQLKQIMNCEVPDDMYE